MSLSIHPVKEVLPILVAYLDFVGLLKVTALLLLLEINQ